MDMLIDSEGLWHIPEFIFGLLSYQNLKNCSQLSTKWQWFLTRQHRIIEGKVADFEETKRLREQMKELLKRKKREIEKAKMLKEIGEMKRQVAKVPNGYLLNGRGVKRENFFKRSKIFF